MQVITITAVIILLVGLASDVTCSTNAKDLGKDDNDILRQLLQRMDKMQSHMDQIERHTANLFSVEQQIEAAQPEKKTLKSVKSFPNCAEAMGKKGPSGVYKIHVNNSNIDPFDVYCLKSEEYKTTDGKWLVIQKRQDNTTEFYQNWSAYKSGFGDLKENFWIGLDKLNALTKSTKQELWIQLTDRDGIKAWAKYGAFEIGDESELYKLKVLGRYHGTAGDSLRVHEGQKWSTFDKDNDKWAGSCAEDLKGAWWYARCGYSSLNGEYGDNGEDRGIIWYDFRGWTHSMKYAHMAIRPKTYE